MNEGFDLKTASVAVRKAAAALGIKSGRWEPVNADRIVDAMEDDQVAVRVWNKRKSIELTAGEIRYAEQYLV